MWIIDFEDAVMFSEETEGVDMKVDSFPCLEECARPLAPDVLRPGPFCPFKVDVWQFGQDLASFDVSACAILFLMRLSSGWVV